MGQDIKHNDVELLIEKNDEVQNERGVTMIEDAMMGALIAIALVAIIPLLTNGISTGFNGIGSRVATAN